MLRRVLLVSAFLAYPVGATAQAPGGAQRAATTTRTQANRALDSYFAALHAHDFSKVPYTPDTVFRGSVKTEPVRGASAVRDFFVAVANMARDVRPQWRVIDGDRACVHYEYELNAGPVVPVVACFRFEAGRIAEERAFFDPRPFLPPCPPAVDTTKPN
jgi:SnoaL-like domain